MINMSSRPLVYGQSNHGASIDYTTSMNKHIHVYKLIYLSTVQVAPTFLCGSVF